MHRNYCRLPNLLKVANYFRIFYRWINQEDHVDIYKNIICLYSSTVPFVWSRNTVRESSHMSFFYGGDPLCVLEWWPENTLGGVDRFAWVSSRSIIIDIISYFQLPRGNMNILFASRIILFITGFRNLYTSGFFSGNLLILSANGNICHTIFRQ